MRTSRGSCNKEDSFPENYKMIPGDVTILEVYVYEKALWIPTQLAKCDHRFGATPPFHCCNKVM